MKEADFLLIGGGVASLSLGSRHGRHSRGSDHRRRLPAGLEEFGVTREQIEPGQLIPDAL